jgi:flagellar basal-body rod protein FlgC
MLVSRLSQLDREGYGGEIFHQMRHKFTTNWVTGFYPGCYRHAFRPKDIRAMLSAVSTALSGLAVATLRLNVAANNIANAQSAGALPGTPGPAPYTPLQVVQSEGASGTAADTEPVDPAYIPAFDPQSPDANAQGLVAMPNIDLTQEIVQLTTAQQSYAANLKTLQTGLSTTGRLLAIV